MMRVLSVMALLVLAGCSGPTPQDTMGGIEAATKARDAVAGDFEYLLYLGTTGTEGPLNWTAYEAALATAASPGDAIAQAFDQDVDNGVVGDGGLGSWLTTHFVFDGKQRLLGGLYTQTTPEGSSSVYAPFRGPYAGTLALPSLQPNPGSGLDFFAPQDGNGTVLCGLLSGTQTLKIDSKEAAKIAMERPLMQEHVAAIEGGEFSYTYFPQLAVEPGCPAELNVRSNYWTVQHADLDVYLAGGLPEVAEVVINAETGAVIDEGIRPVYQPAPTITTEVLSIIDPMVPELRPSEASSTIEVPEHATSLDVTALRTRGPSIEREGYTRLVQPDGLSWGDHPNTILLHQYTVRDPAPGTWTLEYVSYGHEPGADHEIHVRAVIEYV